MVRSPTEMSRRQACRLLAASGLAAGPGRAAAAGAEGRVAVTELTSRSFARSKTGVDARRRASVYLPPGYDTPGARFPAIYYLNHFFEGHAEPFASHGAKAVFDRAIASGTIPPVMVIAADFSTPMGGSWYVDSPATGDWERFMVGELVPHIDATFRTLPRRESRAVVGDRAGGYGALRFGMRRPDVFGTVFAMHPLGLGVGEQPMHTRPNWARLAAAKSAADLGDDVMTKIFASIYQAFLPNPARGPLYFDPPVRLAGGSVTVDAALTARLHRDFLLANLVPTYAENLRSLRGLRFDWGREDPIVDHIEGARALANMLKEFGVPFEAEAHAGGFGDRHWGENGRMATAVLPYLAKHLSFEA